VKLAEEADKEKVVRVVAGGRAKGVAREAGGDRIQKKQRRKLPAVASGSSGGRRCAPTE